MKMIGYLLVMLSTNRTAASFNMRKKEENNPAVLLYYIISGPD